MHIIFTFTFLAESKGFPVIFLKYIGALSIQGFFND